jgi:hypothetical protein
LVSGSFARGNASWASWKESRIQRLAPLVITLLLGVCETVAYKFPYERQIETETTLTVVRNSVGGWFETLALIFWAACFVCSLMSLVTRNKWGFLSILGFLVCPCVGLSSGLDNMDHTYIDEGSTKDKDGTEYHLLANSMLQGHKLLLAKVSNRDGSRTSYSIFTMASCSGDSDHVLLIRPQGKRDATAPIITKERLLIAAFGSYAYGAYDLKRPTKHVASEDDRGYPISKVSPFVLIDLNDKPSQTDFEAAIKEDGFNVTDPVVLKSELLNPNPRVRDMAKKWLAKLADKPSRKPGT